MSNILFIFMLNILSVNPTVDYQINTNLTENNKGEKYVFHDYFSIFSTATFNQQYLIHEYVFWEVSKLQEEEGRIIFFKNYFYYRNYDENRLSGDEKNKLINEIDSLLESCVEKTNYPKRMYLTNNYKKNKPLISGEYSHFRSIREAYNRSWYKIIRELIYNHHFYTFMDIISIKADLSYFLRDSGKYLELRKRIKTVDLFEKCYFYASGYPYGVSFNDFSHDSRYLIPPKNLDEVKAIAEQVYLLAYKHHMVSYIMSTDSNYASIPVFLLKKYMSEGNYRGVARDNETIEIDDDLLKFIFNYMNILIN